MVQPLEVETGYLTPQVNRYRTYRRRHYNQTRFGLDAWERPNGRTTAAGECGVRTQPSTVSNMVSQAEVETESDEDKSVDLGSQDSTRSGESHEYRKDDDDEDDYIVYC